MSKLYRRNILLIINVLSILLSAQVAMAKPSNSPEVLEKLMKTVINDMPQYIANGNKKNIKFYCQNTVENRPFLEDVVKIDMQKKQRIFFIEHEELMNISKSTDDDRKFLACTHYLDILHQKILNSYIYALDTKRIVAQYDNNGFKRFPPFK
jgi:hypothetical protein